ncbi:PA2169 family four-helix-bundle protein [Oleisolibacter albus]|uniref:PA2169 family four-helix-bundle protein n=1 Tax=Oleisolibacter albus TaxID=2171757 RepID=UPI00138FB8E2|nr:PA2169 family four-helix-bundle protein [Oleisolibacter albus]
MDGDALTGRLNALIRVTEDSHLNLRQAAERAEIPAIKSLFNDLAARRAALVRDLQQRVAAQGGTPEAAGTLLGEASRLAGNLLIAPRGAGGLVAAAVRDQEALLGQIQTLLSADDLPPGLRDALSGHLVRVQQDRDRLAKTDPALADEPATRHSA